ncbi:hypothetical protein K469DRAFT_750369 [Zopfia rhizophila CBS 207.26]|uniref:Glycoside hydrolase family 18 protein n=1 Tax=Zopfia rhizophila CBS 207.26 TaxID=1314779 RepID=A0A6A6E145_9PEZI|nr:hypothetical protein K469DRAFT_750369 [Zopfia rhizophila CBS 207.26]
MARLSISTLSFFLFFLFFFSPLSLATDVPEVELLPLNKHGKRTSFQKRMEDPDDGYGGLDLQNFGIFLWGAEATSTMMVANLTLNFAQDYEAIVDMDDFAGLVKSIDCTAPDLALEFKDEKSFAYAHQVWDWVNSDDNFTFVLVASAEACEAESRRQPFLVSDLDFDEVNNKVLMKAVLKTWEDIAVTYSFKITNEPLTPGSPALAKRDGKTLSLAHDFSRRLFDVNTKGLDIGVSCSPCGIEGSVNVDFDLETVLKVPVGASMKITPQNIAAAVELSLHLGGKLASAYSPGDVNVVSVPLTGFNVGGFFKLGIFLTVDLGFEIDEWTGTAQASMGARMSIPNTSTLKVNLFGKGDNAISGWVPEFSKIPPSLSAKVEGSAEAYAQAGVEVTAKGLGKGFSVGLDMKMPYIRADFSAMADSKGVCSTKKTLGVDLQADVGAELYASASLNDDPPFWTHTLFDKTLGTLIDKCYPFGPDNAATGGGGGNPPPKKTKKPKSKTKKASSKKPSAHPKTSAPEKTLKPVKPTSKKPRPTNPKPTKATKTKSITKAAETTKTLKPTDKSSHTSKSSSKHNVSKGGSSAAHSSHSGSHSLPASSRTTVTEVTITTSNIVPSKSDTTPADSTRSSSGSLSLSSSSVSSSVRFSNASSTHVATSKPASGTLTTPPASITTSSASSSSVEACPISGCYSCKSVDPQPYIVDSEPAKRLARGLERRASKRPIKFNCDSGNGKFKGEVAPDTYFGPSENVPAPLKIEPAFLPADDKDCINYDVVGTPIRPVGSHSWATEHIYEANWIVDFLVDLAKETDNCTAISALFLNGDFKPQSLPTPTKQTDWAGALMSSIGTKLNTHLMVYFDQSLNNLKYSVFQANALISNDRFDAAPGGFPTKMSLIASIARVQKYMTEKEITKKMQITADTIETTLRRFFSAASTSTNQDVKNAFEVLKKKFATEEKLAAHHREYLKGVVDKGSKQAVTRIQELAQRLSKSVGTATQTYSAAHVSRMTDLAANRGIPQGMRGPDL